MKKFIHMIFYPKYSLEGTITILSSTKHSNPSVFLFATKEDYLHWITDKDFRPRERIVGVEIAKSGSYRWNLYKVREDNTTMYGYQFNTPQPYYDKTYSVWAIVVYPFSKNIFIK